MSGGDTDRPGAGPDDAELGRLLAEGLGRHAGGPVDENDILAGARRGAVRIRRRRAAAVRVAAALVVVLPLGATVVQLSRSGSDDAAGSSAAAPVSAADSPMSVAGSAPGAATDGAGEAARGTASAALPSAESDREKLLSTVGPSSTVPVTTGSSGTVAASTGPEALRLTDAGQVVVPDDALLAEGDLPRLVLTRVSDTANRLPAPVPAARETCGRPLTEVPEAAGSRELVLEQRTAAEAARWTVADTVRVYRGTGAGEYLAAARRLGCTEPVTVLGAEGALAGRSRDDEGRVRWYGVVQVGRTIGEVRLDAPVAVAPSRAEVERLLRTAADRVTASGLPRAAATGLQR